MAARRALTAKAVSHKSVGSCQRASNAARADLAGQISGGRSGIDDHAWAEIICLAGLGNEDLRRFGAAQRTCALRWLAVLWKQRDTKTEEFTGQFDRLHSAAAAS